jgi:creatinine amidohydrolase/Fe(II)-dependent formamide hydrolase-like protein
LQGICHGALPGRYSHLNSSAYSLMRRGGVAAVSPVGVLGDPTTATADEGRRIFSEMVDGCVRRVVRWAPGPNGMLT